MYVLLKFCFKRTLFSGCRPQRHLSNHQFRIKHSITGKQDWQTSKNDFTDSDCKKLKKDNFKTDDIEKCKYYCLRTQNCNAINYHRGGRGDCVVRHCTWPVLPPVKDNNPTSYSHWLVDTGSYNQGHCAFHSSHILRWKIYKYSTTRIIH